MKDLSIQIYKPFGPSIAKIKMSTTLVDDINKYTDEVVANKKKSKDLDYGDKLVGSVRQEFVLERSFMDKIKWTNFLAAGVNAWLLNSHKIKIAKFTLMKSWIVRQFKNDYNPTHYHNGHISGVGYLKVPKKNHKTNNKNINDGKLQLIHGSRAFLSDSTFTAEPEVGDFWLFPHYLMHTVFPFKNSDEERRSISFNAKIDDKAFDVFDL
jgi:hypothetical protein